MRNLHLHRVTVEACAAHLDHVSSQRDDPIAFQIAARELRDLLPKEYAPEETAAALTAELVDSPPEPTVRNRRHRCPKCDVQEGEMHRKGCPELPTVELTPLDAG